MLPPILLAFVGLVISNFFLSASCQTPFSPAVPHQLVISFNSTVISPNGLLIPESVASHPPQLYITPRLSNATAYLAILIDPTAGTPSQRVEVLHYIQPSLIPSATSTRIGNATVYPLTSNVSALAPYLPPAPPPGSGVHTYMLFLYAQPRNFKIPSAYRSALPLNVSNLTNRYPFNLTKFVMAADLSPEGPVAEGGFDIENGTATATATSMLAAGTPSYTSMANSPAGTTAAGEATSSTAMGGVKRSGPAGGSWRGPVRRSWMGAGAAAGAAWL